MHQNQRIAAYRNIIMSERQSGAAPIFYLNGLTWLQQTPESIDQGVLGTVEEWLVAVTNDPSNNLEPHVFHVHTVGIHWGFFFLFLHTQISHLSSLLLISIYSFSSLSLQHRTILSWLGMAAGIISKGSNLLRNLSLTVRLSVCFIFSPMLHAQCTSFSLDLFLSTQRPKTLSTSILASTWRSNSSMRTL